MLVKSKETLLLQDLREQIVEAGMYLYHAHLVGFADGNISARDPETNLVAVKPSGVPWPKIRAEDVVIVDVNENVVQGDRTPSSETPMHTCFYRSRPEINGVVHCHAPYATAWSVVQKPIPSIIVNQILNGGEIPIAPFTLPGTLELGTVAMEVMGKGNSVVLGSHGTLTVGGNLMHALHITFALEDAAKTALYAQLIGGEMRLMTQKDFDDMITAYASKKK